LVSQHSVEAAGCKIAAAAAVGHLVEAIIAVEVAGHHMDEGEAGAVIRVSTTM
jgi:hypothetical protein